MFKELPNMPKLSSFRNLRFAQTGGLYNSVSGGLLSTYDGDIAMSTATMNEVNFTLDEYKQRMMSSNFIKLYSKAYVQSLHEVYTIPYQEQVDPAKENIASVKELLPANTPEDHVFSMYVNRLVKHFYHPDLSIDSFVTDFDELIAFMDKHEPVISGNIVCSVGQMLKDFLMINRGRHQNVISSNEYITQTMRYPMWLWLVDKFTDEEEDPHIGNAKEQFKVFNATKFVNETTGPRWIYDYLIKSLFDNDFKEERDSMRCYACVTICIRKQPYLMLNPRTVFIKHDHNNKFHFTLVELPSVWGV